MIESELVAIHQQIKEQGCRRILVLQGSFTWTHQQIERLQQALIGDWYALSSITIPSLTCFSFNQAKGLLGKTFLHGVFDARKGFNAEAFAIMAGALSAGSFLVLLLPNPLIPEQYYDEDSLRWSGQEDKCLTVNFIQHLLNELQQDKSVIWWQEGYDICTYIQSDNIITWQPPHGQPTSEQASILKQLHESLSSVYVLTAARGRGKSALAGFFIAQNAGKKIWLTSISKASSQAVFDFASNDVTYWAPDALLEYCQKTKDSFQSVDWLIIDEAAAIPLPLLNTFFTFFPKILLITTIQGYEGSGRGFILKFCAQFKYWQLLTLTQPIRWSEFDYLEPFVERLLLMSAQWDLLMLKKASQGETSGNIDIGKPDIRWIKENDFIRSSRLLNQFYGLLTSAHYRTTPLDLRRLLDAPDQILAHLSYDEHMIGAIWGVKEGKLSASLAQLIWRGQRRPRGNLVAQSLAAHVGIYQAAQAASWRISRIAVDLEYRQRGYGKQLVNAFCIKAKQQQQDFVSVIFGYTQELAQFWTRCGFTLVHLGSHKQASSGCYSAMMIYPITPLGKQIASISELLFKRNLYAMGELIVLPKGLVPEHLSHFDKDDLLLLSGFAYHSRPFEVSYPLIKRWLESAIVKENEAEIYSLLESITKKVSHQTLGLGRQQAIELLREKIRRNIGINDKETYPFEGYFG